MPGRPRTMAKRVRKLLERHQRLAEELRNLGKHHMPATGEPWDFEVPGGDVDPIPPLWRKAVFEASCLDDYIDDLLCFLEMKVVKADQFASGYVVDAADGLGDGGEAESELAAYSAAAALDGQQSAPHSPAAEADPAGRVDDNRHGDPAATETAEPPAS